jgi:hypothetical protein
MPHMQRAITVVVFVSLSCMSERCRKVFLTIRRLAAQCAARLLALHGSMQMNQWSSKWKPHQLFHRPMRSPLYQTHQTQHSFFILAQRKLTRSCFVLRCFVASCLLLRAYFVHSVLTKQSELHHGNILWLARGLSSTISMTRKKTNIKNVAGWPLYLIPSRHCMLPFCVCYLIRSSRRQTLEGRTRIGYNRVLLVVLLIVLIMFVLVYRFSVPVAEAPPEGQATIVGE